MHFELKSGEDVENEMLYTDRHVWISRNFCDFSEFRIIRASSLENFVENSSLKFEKIFESIEKTCFEVSEHM